MVKEIKMKKVNFGFLNFTFDFKIFANILKSSGDAIN